MKSNLTDSLCSLSTYTRMVRNNDVSRRLRPRSDFYLWFFGQVHAKRLLVYMQLFILLACLSGFYFVSNPHFTGLPVAGFDDDDIFGGVNFDEKNNIIVKKWDGIVDAKTHKLTVESPGAVVRRKVVSFLSYFYLFSILMTVTGIKLVDKCWLSCSQGVYNFFNPGLLLIPCLLSVISFSFPLFVFSVRTLRHFVAHSCFFYNPVIIPCNTWNFYEDVAVYVAIPLLLTWIIYGYIVYGCVLGFVYAWRRSRGAWAKKEAAASSFSWSFRDKQTLLGRLSTASFLHSKSFGRGGSNSSCRSTKSTDRPTLRSYKNLNDSRISMSSTESENQFSNSESCIIEVEEDFRRTDFVSHRPSIRRPLATVMEEGESQENSLGSDSSRL